MAPATRCSRCGRDNDPSFSFCLDCGQSLKVAADRLCARCGARMPAAFRFCGHCGQAVEGGAVPAGRLTPAPATPPPVAPAPPRVVVVRHDGVAGSVHPLAREVTTCGRREGEIRFPEDGTVSPRHASLTVRDGRIWLEDLGSACGTFVRLRAARALVFGDEVRMGRQLLRLEPLPRPSLGPGEARPWGSSDPGYRARLVQALEGGGTGEAFPLRAGTNTVGRETGDVTFPGDRYVSGRHARVDVSETAVTLTDLNSSNGTFVRLGAGAELAPGDHFLVGMQLLRVEA